LTIVGGSATAVSDNGRRVAGDVMMVVCGGESERRDEEEARGKNSACVYFVLADMFCHTNTQCYFLYIKKKIN
jgi:hypothetical protein